MSHRVRLSSRRRAAAAVFGAEPLESRVLLATASGVVFHDLNNDGVRAAAEPGASGRRVYQDLNNNGVFDSAEPTTFTDAFGAYTLTLFPVIFGSQTARVREALPAGWLQTAPAGGAHVFAYNDRSIVTGRDFGSYQLAVPAGNVVAVQRALGIRVMFTDNSVNETEYIVQRKRAADPNSAYAEVGRVAGGTRYGNRFGFTGLGGVAGETYNYRVLTANLAGSVASANVASLTVGAGPTGTGATATWYDEQFFGGPPLTLDAPAGADLFLPGGSAPDPRVGDETFSGVFAALLRPEFTDDYTFFTWCCSTPTPARSW